MKKFVFLFQIENFDTYAASYRGIWNNKKFFQAGITPTFLNIIT